MVIREYSKVELVFSSSESEAVKIALVNLRRDLIRTLDCSVIAGALFVSLSEQWAICQS